MAASFFKHNKLGNLLANPKIRLLELRRIMVSGERPAFNGAAARDGMIFTGTPQPSTAGRLI
jgi:hypothetical protein